MMKAAIMILIFLFSLSMGITGPAEDIRNSGESLDITDATRVWEKFCEINYAWMNPMNQDFSYSLYQGEPKPGDEHQVLNEVEVQDGKNLNFSMKVMDNGNDSFKGLDCRMRIKNGMEKYSRPMTLLFRKSKRAGNTRLFIQGVLWHTGIHELGLFYYPMKTHMVKSENPEQILILETHLEGRYAHVGFGLRHLELGAAHIPMYRTRIYIRYPNFTPLREEYFDEKGNKSFEIIYGNKFYTFGNQYAPEQITFHIQPDKNTPGYNDWKLDAHFQKIGNLWLLKEGFNIQDGKTLQYIHTDHIKITG